MKKAWKWLKRNWLLSLMLISFGVWIVVTAWFTMAAISFMIGLAFWKSVRPGIKIRTGMAIASITAMILAIETWQEQAEANAVDEVMKVEPAVVALNTDDQLYNHGIDGSGKVITPKYTSFTVMMKKYKGQRHDHVTLRDEGDFHSSFEIERDGATEFRIVATDWKTGKLEKKYGVEIFGLTPANIDRVAELIKPGMIRSFRKTVGV